MGRPFVSMIQDDAASRLDSGNLSLDLGGHAQDGPGLGVLDKGAFPSARVSFGERNNANEWVFSKDFKTERE